MKVLVACEFSGVVRSSFAARGHIAMSCDLLNTETEDGWHYIGDVRNVLEDGWDLMIAHPPCTRLANSGVRWLRERDLWEEMRQAAEFFKTLLDAPIPMIAIENPIPHRYALDIIGRKYDQIIQPWQFGHPDSKSTCLWLKNLPLLQPTNILARPESGYWSNQTPSGQNRLPPSEDRWKERSRTYRGIAEAMAKQWGELNGGGERIDGVEW